MKLKYDLCATTALLCSTLGAQSATGDQLLAFVRAKTCYVARQDVDGGCKAPTKIADTISGAFSLGGGAAYDPATHSVWVSDGRTIRNLDLAGKTICEFQATLTASDWVVTGLAFHRSKRLLVQLEVGLSGRTTMMNIRTYDASKCPALALPLANKNGRAIPATGGAAAGIACDSSRDLIYFSESSMGYLNSVNRIHVARLSDPCTDINTGTTISVSNCAPRYGPPVTGLAYSDGTHRLYVTLLDQTRVLHMIVPTIGLVTDLTTSSGNMCCPTGNFASYQGTAVQPDFSISSVGNSCLTGACASCASMRLDLAGAPILGNPEFAFRVESAPAGASGSFFLSLGACSSGVQVPGLCGPVYPAIQGVMPIYFGSFALTGDSSCAGSVTVRTGMPADLSLRGLTMCTQWLVSCSGGIGLTNAVQFTPGG